MSGWQGVTFTCAVLFAVQSGLGAAAAADAVIQARPAMLFNPAARCPDLLSTSATNQAAAVVLFRVGPTGAPSQASIKSSSGSEALDAAATACVLRLRYFPVLARGEGTAVESWQQMAFGWRKPEEQPVPHSEPSGTAPVAGATRTDVGAKPPLPREGKTAVRVCVDETGQPARMPTIVQSAGDPAFDKAAIDIASSGHYPPPTKNGKAAADCFPVTVGFEVK